MSKIILDIETNSLSPVTKITDAVGHCVREHNRILCISLINLDNNETKSFYGEDEIKFLTDFHKYLDEVNVQEIIGFNLEFDVNFIRVRSFRHNIKISNNFLDSKKIDLRKVISSEEYSVGTLRFWGETFGVIATTDNGSKMLQLYEDCNWEEIKLHSEEDCILTQLLYQRCKGVNLL